MEEQEQNSKQRKQHTAPSTIFFKVPADVIRTTQYTSCTDCAIATMLKRAGVVTGTEDAIVGPDSLTIQLPDGTLAYYSINRRSAEDLVQQYNNKFYSRPIQPVAITLTLDRTCKVQQIKKEHVEQLRLTIAHLSKN